MVARFIKKIKLQNTCGGVAQLGEHLPCTQGVASSNLAISTISTKVLNNFNLMIQNCTLKNAY